MSRLLYKACSEVKRGMVGWSSATDHLLVLLHDYPQGSVNMVLYTEVGVFRLWDVYLRAGSFNGRIHGVSVGRLSLIAVVMVGEIGFEFQTGYRGIFKCHSVFSNTRPG